MNTTKSKSSASPANHPDDPDARQHPRLLFTADEAQTLRARIARGRRSRGHLAVAVRWCEDFVNPDSPHYFDFSARRSDYWHGRQGNFIIPARLLTLALAGWLADRPAFLDTARDAIITMIRDGVPDALGDFTQWRKMQHDAGKYYAMLGLLYDLLGHRMTPDELKQFLDHARETFQLADQHWYANLRDVGNNRGGKWFVGLGIMAVAFADVPDMPLNKPGYALMGPRMLETSLRQTIGYDGGPFEGISYGASHTQFLALAADMFARCGLRDCRHDRRFRGMAEYMVHETIVHTALPNPLNDCLPRLAPALLFRQAMMDRDGVFLWQWDRFAENPAVAWSPLRADGHPGDFADVPWQLLWPDDDASQPIAPDAAARPAARRFRERGVISIRSGWTPGDLHLTFFSGPPSATGHWQGDQNQVTLHALGESFLIDPGYTLPDPQTGIERRAGQAAAHNVVLVDGRGPIDKHEGLGWPVGRIAAFHTAGGNTYARGDASEAYPRSMRRVDRHIQAVTGQRVPNHVLWLDDVQPDDQPHELTMLLHTAPGNRFEVRSAGHILLHGARQTMSIRAAGSAPLVVEQDVYCGHARLMIRMSAVCGRLCLALVPGTEPQAFDVEFDEQQVTARVTFDGGTAEHVLPCAAIPTHDDGTSPAVGVVRVSG